MSARSKTKDTKNTSIAEFFKTPARQMQRTMQEKFNEVERRSRLWGIRIKGVKGLKEVKDYNQKLAEILTQHNVGPFDTVEKNLSIIEIAHPIGKEGDQLIARLHSRVHRNIVVQKAKRTMNAEAGADGTRIVEDMIKSDFELKRKAFKQMKDAHEAGRRVRFVKGKLWIEGQEVAIQN